MKWAVVWGCIGLALSGAVHAANEALVVEARFAEPTQRYPHNIMGSLSAHTDLVVTWSSCKTCPPQAQRLSARLPEALVFEDFAPRLVDMDGDGRSEILVVESDQQQGARLALWALKEGRLVRAAHSDFIGQRFRWLAPIGVADFLGDGTPLVAYVEKPHLDKVLRLVRLQGDRLVQVAHLAGVTNHQIGQETVHSRIVSCAGQPGILALSANGQRVLHIGWTTKGAQVRDMGAAEQKRLPPQVNCPTVASREISLIKGP